jgi:two-component system, OmpR family, response regulator MprA
VNTTTPAGPARVLVVDDDRPVRDSLRRALSLHGYEVLLAADGMEAIRTVGDHRPDVIVLDVMMPGVDGFGVVRRLRQDGVPTPILLLTARDAVADRVTGLGTGADDYLVKPFALEELLARIEALLRRAGPPPAPTDHRLRYADLVVDVEQASVTRGGEPVELTRTEFDLLVAFVENPRRVLSRDVLQERVWGYDAEVTSNAVEVYVGYLRRKLEAGDRPRLIQTVRGFGYVLRAP